MGCLRMSWWTGAVQRSGSGVRAIAMGCTCGTVGGDTRFLTMGAAASDAERRDAPTPGDRRPSFSSFLPCPSLHTGLTLSRIAGEGGEYNAPGEGQPPDTPVST